MFSVMALFLPLKKELLYQVAFKSKLRRRRGIDAGVRFSTSRSMTRRQQRYANEGDLVLNSPRRDPYTKLLIKNILLGGSMNEFLKILENQVQLVALAFMGIVYFLRLLWLFRFKAPQDFSYGVGSSKVGVAYSMMNVAMPWAMESVRRNWSFYLQFTDNASTLGWLVSGGNQCNIFLSPTGLSFFEITWVVWCIFSELVSCGMFCRNTETYSAHFKTRPELDSQYSR